MSKLVEIEYKNLLTKSEYNKVLEQFNFQVPFTQENYYFDTPGLKLRQLDMGLRIRIFADHAEQTLKVPQPDKFHERIELTDSLSLEQANQLTKQQQIASKGVIETKLTELGIQISELHLIGYAKTLRRLAPTTNGLWTLDQTTYFDQSVDYECEVEVQNISESNQESYRFFEATLNNLSIPKRKIKNKVARAVVHYRHNPNFEETSQNS